MKIIKNNKGYTLIELLAVIVVMVSVGTVITSILVSALRGGNKTNSTTLVRQNGDYAMLQMSKMITFAKTFEGVSTDGVNYVTDCVPVAVGPLTPTPTPTQYSYIKIASFDSGQTVFSCAGNSLSSNSASLIDTTNITVSACSFICTQNNVLISPTININFTLSKSGSGLFVENQSTIPFSTSIIPRNDASN